MRKYQFLIIATVFVLDRLTKLVVVHNIPLGHNIAVIPGLFQLSHWENPGAAFSMFAESESRWRTAGLIAFSVVVIVIVAALLWRTTKRIGLTEVALSLIAGGALGNLWDRVAKTTVTDFLDFYIGPHHWPPFNVADSAIVVGGLLLLARILWPSQPEKS